MLRSKTVTVALLILLAVAVLSIGLSQAELGQRQAVRQVLGGAPGPLHYQGLLLNGDSPWPDGDYLLLFSLYEQPTATTPLWSEAWSTPVRNGLFSVTLGLRNPLPPVREGQSLWLGISLPERGEVAPRQPFVGMAGYPEGERGILFYPGQLGLPLEADGRWYSRP